MFYTGYVCSTTIPILGPTILGCHDPFISYSPHALYLICYIVTLFEFIKPHN